MLSKFLIISSFSIILLCLQTNSCNHQTNDKWVSFGPNKLTSLVIFFKKKTTNNEVEDFLRDVVPVEKYNLALIFRLSNSGYDGVEISFSTDTSSEQREQLKKAIKESPIVYKVYENAVPSEIKDL